MLSSLGERLLEHKTLRPSCMCERVDDCLEEALRAPCLLRDPADEPRFHHRRHAHHDEKPTADRKMALETIVGDGERGGYGNCVVTRVRVESGRILRDYVDIPHPEGGDVGPRELSELRKDL